MPVQGKRDTRCRLCACPGRGLASRRANRRASKFIQDLPSLFTGRGPHPGRFRRGKLMKYDLLDFDRFRYKPESARHLARSKALNPNVRITSTWMPRISTTIRTPCPRCSSTRSAAMSFARPPHGSLNGGSSELFLLDSGEIASTAPRSRTPRRQVRLPHGLRLRRLSIVLLTAVKADIVDRPWVADGVIRR